MKDKQKKIDAILNELYCENINPLQIGSKYKKSMEKIGFISYDEYLNMLELSHEEYIKVLRFSIRMPKYFLTLERRLSQNDSISIFHFSNNSKTESCF